MPPRRLTGRGPRLYGDRRTRGGIITFRSEGLGQVRGSVGSFGEKLLEAAYRAAQQVAAESGDLVFHAIADGKLKLTAPAPATLARRVSSFRVPLVDWGYYAASWRGKVLTGGKQLESSSTSEGVSTKSRVSVAVIVNPEGRSPHGILHTDLAQILDKGTKHIRSRPHIGKITSMLHKRFFDIIRVEVARGLSRST